MCITCVVQFFDKEPSRIDARPVTSSFFGYSYRTRYNLYDYNIVLGRTINVYHAVGRSARMYILQPPIRSASNFPRLLILIHTIIIIIMVSKPHITSCFNTTAEYGSVGAHDIIKVQIVYVI